MKAEEIISKFAEENRITDIGICSAVSFEELRETFESVSASLKGFAESDIEKRINPELSLENARSIIAVAVSYSREFENIDDGILRGRISAAAVGRDYHKEVMEILEKLAGELKKEYNFNYKAYTDTGPLSDRAVAMRSGLGNAGKNGCVVTKNGGSAVFIGYIITDLELEVKETKNDVCTGCGVCVKACPTGALGDGYDMTRCISYISQLKRELTGDEMRLMGNSIYGCDRCQMACPLNVPTERWTGSAEDYAPSLEKLLSYSNREFKEVYGDTAIFWRGNAVIKRNAIVCAANSRHKDAEKLVLPFVESENELLKNTAVKAIELMKTEK